MKKKSRPIRGSAPIAPPPVLHGDCFHAFLDEAMKIGNEVAARRAFDTSVEAFLNEKGLVDDFKAWIDARKAP